MKKKKLLLSFIEQTKRKMNNVEVREDDGEGILGKRQEERGKDKNRRKKLINLKIPIQIILRR